MNLAKNTHKVQKIGILDKKIVKLLGLNFPCRRIMLNPGAIKHIRKRHPQDFRKYFQKVPGIIDSPKYIGRNKRIPDSVELIKELEEFVLVSIVKGSNGLLYLSSFYRIGKFTVKKNIKSGRYMYLS